jgi:integrase
MDWFRENRKSVKDTQSTINTYILPTFGSKLVMDLTALEIRRWHEKIASSPPRRRTRAGDEQNYGQKAVTAEAKRSRKSTANRILTVFKAILNKAFEDGLAPDDKEWRKVKPFKQVDEPVVRFLTVAESRRLINACKPDFRRLVQAALFTGCRYGELTRIQVNHVNLDTGMVYISSEAKSSKGRHVPLSEEGLSFFKDQVTGTTGLDYVFKRQDESPWLKNHQSRLMKVACEQAKISPPIGFHELRHTYASLLAQAGADLLTISKLLGHADTRVTSRHYAHLCDKTLTNAVKNLLPSFGHQSDRKVRSIR